MSRHITRHIRPLLLAVILSLSAFVLTACSYYRVTDLDSGRVYYTTDASHDGTAFCFRDERNGRYYRLTSSIEAEEITREQFEAAIAAAASDDQATQR